MPPILRFALPDGRPVALRPVVSEDRRRLADGFQELSETSRRLRFLGAVSELSPATLHYLTDVDHVDHVAWGALDLHDPLVPGFGVGRFIRLVEAPTVAEFSVTVLDSAQGRGVGQTLLALLCVLAPTLGIDTLLGVVARENDVMVAWLRRLGAPATPDGSDLVFAIPVHVDSQESPSAEAFVGIMEEIRRAARALPAWPNGTVG